PRRDCLRGAAPRRPGAGRTAGELLVYAVGGHARAVLPGAGRVLTGRRSMTVGFQDQGWTRRQFVRGLGFGRLRRGLPDALSARRAAGAVGGFGRAKRCILLMLWGGPSQIDTFDMKPDAPAEYRGEFRPVATSAPGMMVCEHLPRVARLAHRFAVVRS